MTTRKVKAVSLLSGGLDSAIATKLIMEQGIEVVGLNFHSPFCTCDGALGLDKCAAVYFAEKLEIQMKTVSKGDDYLELVKNPKFGYGKNINPCIDCRIHILKYAKKYMDEIGADFVITGEVVGQRPKSQNLKAMKIIEEESGLKGKIVRPLSAKLLEPSLPEIDGLIDRQKLMEIKGRRRNIQLELGRNFNIISQYCAGGGCRLTDKNFARKLKDYLEHTLTPTMKDMKYLSVGRHFRYNQIKIIVGRNEVENKQLKAWAKEQDLIVEVRDVVGPITLIHNPKSLEEIEFAGKLTARYSDSKTNSNIITLLAPFKDLDEISVILDEAFLNNFKKWAV